MLRFGASLSRTPITTSFFGMTRSCVNQATTQNEKHPEIKLHPVEALKTDTASGWAPPLGTLCDLPFTFSRTESKLLPVYHRRRKHNTQFITVVRKYRGDSSAIFNALRSLVGKNVKMKQYQGRIEIQGDHRQEVHTWLRRLGF